jgi:Protein of unknown function (DUF3987)/Primase C terminal 1 (PriCT-1)
MNASVSSPALRASTLLLTYTLFLDVWPKEKRERSDVPWEDLVARIRAAPTYIDKQHCPLVSLAEYGNQIDEGHRCLRYAENVRRIFGVEVDYDGEQIPLSVAAERLQTQDIRAVLYTSPSHKPSAPRWRALLPLSEPAAPEKRAEYVARANRVLGGIATRESFTLSQSFYIGRVSGADYEVMETEGRCIDLAGELEPLYLPTLGGNGANKPDGGSVPAELIGEGERNHYLSREAFRLRKQGSSVEQIQKVLAAINEVRCSPPLEEPEVRLIARGKALIAADPGSVGAAAKAGIAGVARVAGGDAEPEPLRRPLPPAERYPFEALGPVLGAAARRIHEVVGAPAAMCGQAILAAASLAAQAHADVEIDGRRELLSLYCFTVGDSGERKTGVDTHALAPHKDYERAAFDEYRIADRAHKIALAAHEATRRAITKGKKDAKAIKSALEELGEPPAPPDVPILLAQAPTLEGIHKLFAVGRPSIGLFHNDAGEFLGGHAMNDENRMKSAAGLSRLWDCGESDRVRSGDGAHKFFGRRLASHLMVQPVIAERVLSDDILLGQGLLARALMTWPTSTIGERPYVSIDLTRDPGLLPYRALVRVLLERRPSLREGTTNELDPRTLQLTPEARAAWIGIHDMIEAEQRDGGDYASVRPWASKAASQVLRIAGVLTLLQDPDAGVIHQQAIDSAAALIDHYLGEAIRLVGTASVPLEIRNAEALRDWCHRERKELLHSKAALQFGPTGIRTVAAFNSAIEVLERHYWAERVEGGCEIDGAHRRRAWRIRRALS